MREGKEMKRIFLLTVENEASLFLFLIALKTKYEKKSLIYFNIEEMLKSKS
jgi:hypothetical protein